MENQNKNSLLGVNEKTRSTNDLAGSVVPLQINEKTKTVIEAPEILRINSVQNNIYAPETLKVNSVQNNIYTPETLKVESNKVESNTKIQESAKPMQPDAPSVMSVTTSNQIKTPEIQSNLNNRTSASQLEQKNKDLLSLQNKVNQTSEKNVSMKTIEMLQPAFQNIENALKFTASLNQKRDFDDSHYTIPTTQSLFTLTANQISNMPSWRK